MRLLVIALALALFSGCAITTKVPANRFDSPEAIGKGAEVLGGFEGDNEYVLTPDDTATPPNFSNPTFDRSYDFLANGGISLHGLTDRIDFYGKLRTAGFLEGEVKLQILGKPRAVAKKGNFSFAVTAGGGGATSSGSDTNSGFLSTSTTTAQYSTNTSAIDFAGILGYRLDDHILFYTGYSWTRLIYSGTLTQSISGQSGSTQYLYSGQLRQSGVNAGFEFDPAKLVARVEYALAWTSAVGTGTGYHDGYVGAEIGFTFGDDSAR